MTLRTFVSFEAAFPTDGQPAGHDLADFIAIALQSRGFSVAGPTNREDWAWNIAHKSHELSVETIVGHSDDGPRQWQIHSYLHPSFTQRLLPAKKHEFAARARSYFKAMHEALKGDPRFKTIRWYEEASFERDHGESWGNEP